MLMPVCRLGRAAHTRLLLRGRMINLGQDFQPSEDDLAEKSFDVLVDRLKTGDATTQRVRDSLETAFSAGDGRCVRDFWF